MFRESFVLKEQIDVLVSRKYSGYVHEEEVEEGKPRRNNDYILLFASDTGIHLLQEASEIFMDGTFGTVTCVPPFVQIVFLQAKVGEKRPLPAAFALLTRKVTSV
jgi:hypothetical protein